MAIIAVNGLGQVVDQTWVKVMGWYDNEWGITCQMIREALTVLGLPVPELAGPRG
jgi:glyceraldehyde 3-phosphate dehydrogenase